MSEGVPINYDQKNKNAEVHAQDPSSAVPNVDDVLHASNESMETSTQLPYATTFTPPMHPSNADPRSANMALAPNESMDLSTQLPLATPSRLVSQNTLNNNTLESLFDPSVRNSRKWEETKPSQISIERIINNPDPAITKGAPKKKQRSASQEERFYDKNQC